MIRLSVSAELVRRLFTDGVDGKVIVRDGIPKDCHLTGASLELELKPGVVVANADPTKAWLVLEFAEPSDPPGRPGPIRSVTPEFSLKN